MMTLEELYAEDIVNILIAIDNWLEDHSEDAEISDAEICEYFKHRIDEYKNLKNKLLKF